MASSDEEGEILPAWVTDYHLLMNKEEYVPFNLLPLQWSEFDTSGALKEQIFLRGVDDDLQMVYKQATAWKFELSNVHPQISVLTKSKVWIQLLTPLEGYENKIRTILITIHCLHFIKKNPEASGESLWNHLLKIFSSYDVKPSENDLLEHTALINQAAIMDKDLVKSKYLLNFLLGKPREEIISNEDIRAKETPKFKGGQDDYDEKSYEEILEKETLKVIGSQDDFVEKFNENIREKEPLKVIGGQDDYVEKSHKDVREKENLKVIKCEDDYDHGIQSYSSRKLTFLVRQNIRKKMNLKVIGGHSDSHNKCHEDIQEKENLKDIIGEDDYDAKFHEDIRNEENLKVIRSEDDCEEKSPEEIHEKEDLNLIRGEDDFDEKSHEDIQEKENLKVVGGEDGYNEVEWDGEGNDLFDHVCSLCDNGGNILCCEGRCMRSFHATIEDGTESSCESLRYSAAQVHAIKTFLCKNCQYQQHQCFVCGMLGSSDITSGAEVFPCVSATCGYFFHPVCVAKLLYLENETRAKELQNKIAKGESFTCPAHKCFICKKGEDKTVHDLQFAVCRRCPKAYHRKCLPKKIRFESFECHKRRPQRAWDGLIPNRILIYCMEHKIVAGLWTPERNHIIFPDYEIRKMKKLSPDMKATTTKRLKEIPKQVKVGDYSEKNEEGFRRQGYDTKNCITDCTTKILDEAIKSDSVKGCGLLTAAGSSLLSKTKVPSSRPDAGSTSFKSKQQKTFRTNIEKEKFGKSAVTSRSLQPKVDYEMEKKINCLIKKANASFDEEKFRNKLPVASTYASSSNIEKTILSGRVEVSANAVRDALQKLEKGYRVEEAKAVCEPQILNQIVRWKGMLRVYLGPFLHGSRYTSYGRHFTQVRKLREIVDFCCGANDFSCLMKEKLDKMGKMCLFKNYDLIPPKNDFFFENRDWFTIHPNELPRGSQLIMGLNPPFGVKASLANKFIDKALEFKPKLLILIVPKETTRLDKKHAGYDLIWEDSSILSGKSFYLPGSVDVHDKQLEQWNNDPPPLYLWSRPDWTTRHKKVAHEHGHYFGQGDLNNRTMEENGYFFGDQGDVHIRRNNLEPAVSSYIMKEKRDCYRNFSPVVLASCDISPLLDNVLDETATEVTNNAASDGENLSETNGVMDMEVASPVNDPFSSICSRDKSNKVIDMLEMEAKGVDKWVKQRTISMSNLGFRKNYAGAQIPDDMESNSSPKKEETSPCWTETSVSSPRHGLCLKRKYDTTKIVNPMQRDNSSKGKNRGAKINPDQTVSRYSRKKEESIPCENLTNITTSVRGQPSSSFPYDIASQFHAYNVPYYQQQDYYAVLYCRSFLSNQDNEFSQVGQLLSSAYGYPGSTFSPHEYAGPWMSHFTPPPVDQYEDDVPPVPGLGTRPESLNNHP